MKALHITTSKSGGAGIAAQRINEALVSVGVESVLWDRKQILNELDLGISHQLKIKLVSPMLTRFQRGFVQKGSELMTPYSLPLMNFSELNKLNFDVINIHSFYNLLTVRSFEELSQLSKPVVITLHDLRLITGGCHAEIGCKKYKAGCKLCPKVHGAFRTNVAKQKESLTSILLGSSNITLVSPSRWLSSLIIKNGKVPESRVRVINNPVPDSFGFTRNGRVQKGKLIVGFSAYDLQSPYKGLEVLARAIRSLPPQIQQMIELHLKGENFPRSDFFKGIDSSIINASDVGMSQFYRCVDAVVVPSVADNFPSVAVEAIAANCILISSDSGGLKEISKINNGLIFENANYFQLKEILLELTLEKNLVQNNYDGKYSFPTIGLKYKELYSELIN